MPEIETGAAACVMVDDEFFATTHVGQCRHEIRGMLKLSIHLPMTNDQLDSSSNAEI